MGESLQPKGDGEYPYSAPFTGIDVSMPSIVLPPSAQDNQTSPSFAIVRGSICAPWPYATELFGWSLNAGEYFLFATASGFIFTNQRIMQIQSTSNIVAAWNVVQVESMPAGAFPTVGDNNPIPFTETNGCIYFSCNLGIYRFDTIGDVLLPWAVGFRVNFMTIFNQRLVVVGTRASTNNVTPGTPTGASASGSLPNGAYYAVVTAVFVSGTEGPPSAEGTFTATAGGITWTWTAVTGAISYNLYFGNAQGRESQVFTGIGTNSFTVSSFTAGSVSPPVAPPNSPWTVAWSTVSTFSNTSVGSFNSAPNTDAGIVGGFDVLTNYSQGLPAGIINLGHSIYIQMTQGVVEMDPAASGSAPFTFYNYWQEEIQVGAQIGSVAQFGPIACLVTPDNVNIWVPGSQTQIGSKIMPYLRKLLLNLSLQENGNQVYPLLQNPPYNASFYTFYGELHYCLAFQGFGVPLQQWTFPYPPQVQTAQDVGMILDYNFTSQAWTQQITPPLTSKLYMIKGPPLTSASYSLIPTQTFMIASTQASPSAPPAIVVFAPDVFNQNVYATAQCQALSAHPQPCFVGFPQTPISSGHRPAVRRVRIEYSFDELSNAQAAAPVFLTVTLQGTITQNNGVINGQANAQTTIVNKSVTLIIEPPGIIATGSGNIQPFLTATAYADFVLSLENPQVSLSWTDPGSAYRLMIHRVTLMVNDTKGVMQ
jgi:hypothetical protein